MLPLALERKTAAVVNVPLGGRGGRNLSTVSGKPLPPFAAEIGVTSWAQLMLKHVASHPAVTCVISGSTPRRVTLMTTGRPVAACCPTLRSAAVLRSTGTRWPDTDV
ncbi:MAG TPA: hypothetical protein VMU00_09745 [Steroidobacteraceae bacterium]|nr:hypothetical protein [Steroidobacteraceae bacterium]